MTKLNEYTSTITVKFAINNHEAISKEQYIEILKLQFKEQYEIDLMDSEITEIEKIN
jgi:hypothetical protein